MNGKVAKCPCGTWSNNNDKASLLSESTFENCCTIPLGDESKSDERKDDERWGRKEGVCLDF